MPLFEQISEIEWTKEFLKILETIYPGDSMKIIDKGGMVELAHHAPRLCFRHIV